jgi:hypothetical protein
MFKTRFIGEVQERMGPESFKESHERQLVHFFFNARRLGCAPRYRLCTEHDQKGIDQAHAQNDAFRIEMAQWAKDKHEVSILSKCNGKTWKMQ